MLALNHAWRIPNSRFLPDQQTQSLWSTRLSNFGFEAEKFPPIDASGWGNNNSRLALQMLHVASPEMLSSLETPSGIFTTQYEEAESEAYCGDGFFYANWIHVAKGPLFRGKFGLLLHYRYDRNKSVTVPQDDGRRIWRLTIDHNYYSWQTFFNVCMGPRKFEVPGNDLFSESQAFVKPDGLPAYLSVDFESPDNTLRAPGWTWFPKGNFRIKVLCEDGEEDIVTVRWVGGVYSLQDIRGSVVFDWGRDTVGVSKSGNWAKDPPVRRSRDELEREANKALYGPKLLLFRRV
ncbi:uncharacterized protein BKA78DRAFT_142808 [Phyllosticta capitalensis]|uniref:Uncharacterized protein n=1 Tax=Phyllosticta capitalensis TaxID=121624 RepID=A0ABR1YRA6_9PEZI